MATNPGLLSEWPWKSLGSFKFALPQSHPSKAIEQLSFSNSYRIMERYCLLAPCVLHSFYLWTTNGWREVDPVYIGIFPTVLLRLLHNQIWITVSRIQNARCKHQIVDRGIEFEQVDRERNWDDHIISTGILMYLVTLLKPAGQRLRFWRMDGAILIVLLHAGPVEFLYYWFHRALHHHFLYTRYHSHHHASIVTEPITSCHPSFCACNVTGTESLLADAMYLTYIDFMNNMGHCNFEFIPGWLFQWCPHLKYLMYTPSFHSLHHTQFRTNYSLFMPFYDYMYNTMDKSSDKLYESSLSAKEKEQAVDVVHLTHFTSPDSIYHMRPVFAEYASTPYVSKWHISVILWPLTWLFVVLTWMCDSSFTVERNTLQKLRTQSWAVPRYSFQYGLNWEKEAINNKIEKAIREADKKGAKTVSLGLLNQEVNLNGSGKLYLQKYPKLRVRIVDGTSLAAAVVVNNIPQGTDEVVLAGKVSKVAPVIAATLCKNNVKVVMRNRQAYTFLKLKMPEDTAAANLLFSTTRTAKVWVIGEDVDADEKYKAQKGTLFIPFSQFPPRMSRVDCCTYLTTPSMAVPKTLQNVHSCENWLPRRVMSAWRVAGIVHALEGWSEHECGDTVLDVEKVWSAAILHGFRPVAHV
ncbi:hypothetical protein ACP70R_003202 [Stipagrostis hirtigluma subsp. patula]